MKNFILAIILLLSITSAQAENLFQSNNPFPQTMPQSMNNIYESEPATIRQEAKQQQKSSWFKKNKNQQKDAEIEQYQVPVYPIINEGADSNKNFYMFTTGQ